jgi:hypothetical protein
VAVEEVVVVAGAPQNRQRARDRRLPTMLPESVRAALAASAAAPWIE